LRALREEFRSFIHNTLHNVIGTTAPGATENAMRRNIDLTVTQPLKLPASPPLSQLVDFSLLREVHKELGIVGRK